MIQEMCLLKGFTKEQAAKGLETLRAAGGDDVKTTFAPMTDNMMDRAVEQVLESLFKGEPIEGKAITEGRRVVFMAVYSKERAVTIMRTLKALSDNPQDIIFAMVTETALKWTLGKYIEHVSEEHEYMKTHNPAADPDMKKI